MADLHPIESPSPFQEVPRNFVHVHELTALLKLSKHLLREVERLKAASLTSARRVPVPGAFRSLNSAP